MNKNIHCWKSLEIMVILKKLEGFCIIGILKICHPPEKPNEKFPASSIPNLEIFFSKFSENFLYFELTDFSHPPAPLLSW